MYKKFNNIDSVISSSDVIEKDRKNYDKYFQIVEKFCKENDVLLGGQIGIQLLTEMPKNKDSYFYSLYTDDSFNKAKKLSLKLFESDSNFTINLQTVRTHKEFNIYINTRLLVKIFDLGTYKNIRLYKLIGPVPVKGYFNPHNVDIELQAISGEVYLIDIYRKLYTPYVDKPGGYKTYTYYRNIEDIVFKKTIEHLEGKILNSDQRILGSSENNEDPSSLENIKLILLKHLIKNSNDILIGDFAINQITKHKSFDRRLQIISERDPDDLLSIISNILKNQFHIDKHISYSSYDLNLPDDFRILKYTFYISDNKLDRISLMDVFNSSSFELIPFKFTFLPNVQRIKIGNHYVLLRFKFIDLWSLKLIFNLGHKDTSLISGILWNISALRKITISADPSELFQLDNYVGNFIDESVP